MMMKQNITKSKLRQALDSADEVSDEAALATVEELRRFLKNYLRNFKARMADFGASKSELIDLAEQAQMVSMVTEILEESGYGDVVDSFREGLESVGEESLSYFEKFMRDEVTYSGVAREAIELLTGAFVEELDLTIDSRLIRPLENHIRQTTLALTDRKQTVSEITTFITDSGIVRQDGNAFTNYNIETLVSESGRRFAETIRATQAAELGLEVFVYTGPLDKVTSDQCVFLLTETPHGAPGMWYRDELRAGMHPKLKESPLPGRGHHGCRHQWGPIDEAAAKRIDLRFVPRNEGIREAA